MTQLAQNNSQDLLEILVAVAWIDGEIQPEEKKFLEKIAIEQNISSATELQALLANYQGSSLTQCYLLLEKYLGTNPDPADYQNLLTAVSKLIYSDNDIATEEAALLTQIQNLDPHNSQNHSALDKAIKKIRKLYQAGLSKR
ncbi:MAG: TerB family tellurite resistance protein [Waterburya sp.]